MAWRKQGLIFAPPQTGGWMKTHAQVPTPLPGDGSIRVYFSSRPEPNLSLTTFVDLDRENPARVLRVHDAPILELGKPGTFDEHGIMPSCAIRDGDRVLLYYSGWSRGVSVPYTNATGLAVSYDDGESFERISDGPILAKSIVDPYSATSPVVLKEEGAWHMWYCSGTGWLEIGGKYEHVYDIKYAQSDDGTHWRPTGIVSIAQLTKKEALTKPCVLKIGDGYHMWFCYRGSDTFRNGDDAYRIGHAHSKDLLHWERSDDDEQSLERSESGWDSQMVAYPAVFRHGSGLLMFYNGNGFGASGFGMASCPNPEEDCRNQ